MFDLHGRVAVVTGASSGLGAQMAKGFAKQERTWLFWQGELKNLRRLQKTSELMVSDVCQYNVMLLIQKRLTKQLKKHTSFTDKLIFLLIMLVHQEMLAYLI